MASSEILLRGAAELQIDSTGLEARLLIEKKDAGEQWSADSLKALLARKSVVTGFTDESLEAALREASEAGGDPVEVTVARGSAPESPQPEKLAMEELPIPSELQETADELLAAAENPEIVLVKSQVVKRKKIVEKRRALPFLAKKQEVVTVSEKESVPERVYVDPTVEWTGYAEEGWKLATIAKQEPGRSGVSVYGAPLQPKRLADPYVYAGGGVVRRQNELIAERSGFVRRGSNWVDIVPFADHEWHIATSRDNATCLLTFHPGHGNADPPSAEAVIEAAEARDFTRERLLPAEEIDRIIRDALESSTALIDTPIVHSRDADFSIYVSEDKLKAVLTITKGIGRGTPLVLREVGSAIQKSGLKRLNLEQIKHDIMSFYNGPETELPGYVLTEGKAPLPGPDREIEWSVRFLPDEEVQRLHPAHIEVPEADAGTAPDAEAAAEPAGFPADTVTLMAHVEEQQRIGSFPPAVAGEGGVDVYGRTMPAEPRPEPPVHYFEGVRREKTMIIATRTGLFECAELDGVRYMRVRAHRDARVSVEISDDGMHAYLSLDPGEGSGKPITAAEVKGAVSEAGVRAGINEEILGTAVEEASKGAPVEHVLFAEGTPAENEDVPRVEFLIHMASGTPLTVREDGSVDYRNQDLLTTVSAEQKIARVLPSEHKGRDGQDVTGKRLPAQRLSGKPLTAGTNVRVDAADGAELLVSEITGEVSIKERVVSVVSQHAIRGDVDLSTGNIKFPGSVHISGNVRAGFYVFAGGDIKVGEAVEAALLSADGDVVIQQGIKGGGKGAVRSKQKIGAGFAERATLLSVEDIVLKNSCVHSIVKCNGKLTVQARNGSIVGGEIRAREGLVVVNLGSQTGTRTHVLFGQDFLIADQIEREVQAVEKLKAKVAELDIAMHKYERARRATELEQLRNEKKKQLHIIEKRSLRLFTLREKFERHHDSSVDVHGTVYPGVVIESHGRQHEFREPKTKVRIYFDLGSGHIQEHPLTPGAQEKKTQ